MARVLIIAPQWMGDAVMTHSLIKMLAQHNQVDVLCADWLKPIYQRMAEVERVITLPLQHGKFQLALYWQTAKKFKHRYQQCIVIPRKMKSAIIPWLASIPKRTAYLGESRYGLINDIKQVDPKHHLWVQKVAALADKKIADNQAYPLPKLQTDDKNKQKWRSKLSPKQENIIALMPGASYGISKQWSVASFHQIVKQADKQSVFVILGAKNEQKLGQQILQGVDEKGHNLCGITSLYDAIDILAISHQCITNDSGLMHVAAATGCFVKALYGSSSPDYTPPLTDKKQIFSDSLACKPCFKRTCPFGHYDCWKNITPERVMQDRGMQHG